MKYTVLRGNQQGFVHIVLALVVVAVIAGVVGSGYAAYKSSHKAANSSRAVQVSKTNPAPVIVTVPAQSQDLSTSAQSATRATNGSTSAAASAKSAAPAQPPSVVQYTSIPDWGVKVPLVSMTATNLGSSLVVYDRLGMTDANNKTEALFFGSSEASLSEDEGCGAGQAASVYVFRDTKDGIDPSDAAKLTLYKSVVVAGHTYNIYRMLCHGGDWTLDYGTFDIADHLAQMVAS